MSYAKMGYSFKIIDDLFVFLQDDAYFCNVTQSCAALWLFYSNIED